MPEDQEKQKKLDRLLSLLDADNALSKQDFVDSFEKVVDLVLKIQKQQGEAIERLEQTYANLLTKMDGDHTERFKTLRGQVNDLFVKDRLEKMSGENQLKFSELQNSVNSLLDGKLKDVDGSLKSSLSELGKSANQALSGKLKDVDSLIAKINESLNADKLKVEEVEKVKKELERISNVLSNLPRGKGMGRAKSQVVRPVNLSGSVDGSNRSFTLPPDTVQILGIWGSQFPFTGVDGNSDFTFAGNVLTLNDSIATPAAGQTLWALVETLFYP